jgi:triosephosphate isomerase
MAIQKKVRIIAGNWKLHPQTYSEAREIFLATRKAVDKTKGILAIVCPPFLYIKEFAKLIVGKKNILLGAQDTYFENEGAFTGEISPSQLADIGATFVIVGHSERRLMGETDDTVNRKVKASIKAGLSVILCIGERERDEHASYLTFIKNQIHSALGAIPAVDLSKIIIAYEPLWAIGKDESSAITPHDLHQMALFIRKSIAESYGTEAAFAIPILYGGSVGPHNTAEHLKAGVQGLLIGRASADKKEITDIISIAHTSL